MAYKLTVIDKTGTIPGLKFNLKYEKMDRVEKPEIVHKVGDVEVHERSCYQDVILTEGITRKVWCDDQGQAVDKEQITHWYGEQQVSEKTQSKDFEIIGFQPVANYTDAYVIDKFYDTFPADDGCTKKADKEAAENKNLMGMWQLWDYLNKHQVVARADEFNVSSRGFGDHPGYMRAVKLGNAWAIEIGVLKEEKIFRHPQEGIPSLQPAANKPMKLKLVS